LTTHSLTQFALAFLACSISVFHSLQGKTATFVIGALSTLNINLLQCQTLLLAPTRESAYQIHHMVISLGVYLNLVTLLCVGGTARSDDCRILEGGVHVVIGTPGRISYLIQCGVLGFDHLQNVVLDDADEIISMGFKDQVYDLLNLLPESTQLCLCSATMSEDVLELSRRFMRKPVRILEEPDELAMCGVRHFYIAVERQDWKLDTLHDLYQTLTLSRVIIYCNTLSKVTWLAEQLLKCDYIVSYLHSEMDQCESDVVMRGFYSGASCQTLITTDLLARCMNIEHVSLVVNFDMPVNPENYIHRIVGRCGRKGLSICLIADHEFRCLYSIERLYNTKIEEIPQDATDLL
jgi:translation initiation factor 4A